MSNQICLETVEVKRTYGSNEASWIEARIFDNYNNGETIIPKEDCGVNLKDDLSILQYCKDYGSDDSAGMCDVIDSLLENQKGLTINGTFYEWEEIKHLFDISE